MAVRAQFRTGPNSAPDPIPHRAQFRTGPNSATGQGALQAAVTGRPAAPGMLDSRLLRR
ncbi:MAG: hypothetical protein QOG10_5933 [Kribbellaceae bacterium]|nr:hypothetical protein [Kribbellaceae bacterium]